MKITEQNFVEQLKNRNESALEYVMKQYGGLVKSVVHRHLYHLTQYEEDCINEVFWAVWNNSASYQEEKNTFANWIAGVSRLKALGFFRKYARQMEEVSFEGRAVDIADESQNISAQYDQQLSREVEQMLSCLRERDRELFYRLYVEEQDIEEVSEKMDMKRPVIYNRLSRAKRKLRKIYGKD